MFISHCVRRHITTDQSICKQVQVTKISLLRVVNDNRSHPHPSVQVHRVEGYALHSHTNIPLMSCFSSFFFFSFLLSSYFSFSLCLFALTSICSSLFTFLLCPILCLVFFFKCDKPASLASINRMCEADDEHVTESLPTHRKWH